MSLSFSQHLGKSPSPAVGWRGASRPLLAISPIWRITSHSQHHLSEWVLAKAISSPAMHSCTSLSSSLCPAWHPAQFIICPSTEPRGFSGLWFRQHFVKGLDGKAGGEPWGDVMGTGPVQGLCSQSTPCPSRVPTQGKGKLHQSSGQLILSRIVFLPVQKFWMEIHFLKYCFWLHISKQHEKFIFSWKCFL